MTGRVMPHNTKMLLCSFLDQPWARHAQCIKHPHLPWTGRTQQVLAKGEWTERDVAPSKGEQAEMQAICASCIGRFKCADFALKANNRHGVDGGFYGGVYIPWGSYYRGRHPNQDDRSRAKTRLRGMLKMIFVYGRKNCNACDQTKRFLTRLGIPYEYIDIEDPDVADATGFEELSKEFSSLPIVVNGFNGKEKWCGFRYDKIKALKATHGGGK